MASTTVRIDVPEQVSPTLAFVTAESGASGTPNSAGYTMTLHSTKSWLYEITVTEALVGIFRIEVQDGDGATVAQGYVDIEADDTSTYIADASYQAFKARDEIQTVDSQTDANSIRTAVGLASANLDTQLTSLSTQVTTVDTQTDPASLRAALGMAAADLDTQLDALASQVAVVDGTVDSIGSATTAASIRLAVGLASANLDTQLATLTTGQPAVKYAGLKGPGVYLDDDAANTGTTLGTDGTVDNPVSTLAAATTLCASLGANRIYLKGETTLSLAGQTLTEFEFVGLNGPDATILNLGTAASPSVLTRCAIFGCTVYGTHDFSDRLILIGCEIDDAPAAETTKLHVFAENCLIVGDIVLDTSSDNVFQNCADGVPGTTDPLITCTGAAGTVLFRGWSGGMRLQDLSASHNVRLGGWGSVTFESGCNVNADVTLYGHWREIDNTAGMNNLTRDSIRSTLDAVPTLAEILAGGDVDGYSLEESLKLMLAALAGKLSGGGTTTNTIRAADDSKARITATVDRNGNRSAVTLDATS